MKKKILIFLIPFLIPFCKAYSQEYFGYTLAYIADTCSVIKKKYNSNSSQDELMINRQKYKTCMNFTMSLVTTLNGRCASISNEIKIDIDDKNFITYADVTGVNSTTDIIETILTYIEKNPNVSEEAAWMHSSIAISKKWPCNKLTN